MATSSKSAGKPASAVKTAPAKTKAVVSKAPSTPKAAAASASKTAAPKVDALKAFAAAAGTAAPKVEAPKKAEAPAKKPAAPKAVEKTVEKAVPKKAAAKSNVTPEQRRLYIEVAAYHIAERRSFAAGNPHDDWAQAEAEIDRLLSEGVLKP